MGWTVTNSTVKNLLFWCDTEGTIDFAQRLQRWQFLNHIPGMWSIAHKVELVRLYDRMSRALPAVYNFHPRSFLLPLQLNALQSYMAGIPKRRDRTIIVKPDRGAQGRGIQLIQNFEDVEDYDESAVAQTYLPPFLLGGRKFDLRIYVLVTSCDPLRVYIFKEGMARFCTADYVPPNPANLGDSYSHLTNFSLNKNNEAFDFATNKKSLTTVMDELRAAGADADKVWKGIERIVRLTLIAAQPFLSATYHTGITANDGKSRCFEILGFDIFLDDKADPWLLEVNCMPSLAGYSQFDVDLKTRVISDTLRVIDLQPTFKQRCMKRFKMMSAQGSSGVESVFDPERESQIAKATDWIQLLPVVDDKDMESVCAEALSIARGSVAKPKPPAEKAKPRQKPVVVEQPQRILRPKLTEEKRPEAPKVIFKPNMSKFIRKPRSLGALPVSSQLPPPPELVEPPMELKPDFLDVFGEPTSIFELFSIRENRNVINQFEEADRVKKIRKRAQVTASIGMLKHIRSVLKDGRVASYDDPKGKPKDEGKQRRGRAPRFQFTIFSQSVKQPQYSCL